LRDKNAIAIEITTGYGASDTDVPADIRHVIKLAAAHRYEHRGETIPIGAENAEIKILRPMINRYKLQASR